MSQSSIACKKCGHVWKPRKSVTRYQRQCPNCDSYELDVGNPASLAKNSQTETPAIDDKTSTPTTKLPRAIYDLMGISGASSIENAIQRAFELMRKLIPYKYRYGLESPEAVFEFLEKQASSGSRRATEAEARLDNILAHPELIFYETSGVDLAAVDWYQALGYKGNFLDFLSETISAYFEKEGLELGFRENQ